MKYCDRIDFAIKVSREAGILLLNMFKNRSSNSSSQKGIADIVTEADFASERHLINSITKVFPEDSIISEEKDIQLENTSSTAKGFSWVLDPLDGTRNFSIGNPNFVVSIGLLLGGQIIGGVVYFPILDQLFVSDNSKAYLNDNLISVNRETLLKDSIIGFWDKREKDPNYSKVDILNKLRGKVKVLRMFGASAMEKAWVANGQLDLYIGNSSSIFGAVAGISLVRNAGGVAYNLEGEEWKLGDVGIICGNEGLVKEALFILSN